MYLVVYFGVYFCHLSLKNRWKYYNNYYPIIQKFIYTKILVFEYQKLAKKWYKCVDLKWECRQCQAARSRDISPIFSWTDTDKGKSYLSNPSFVTVKNNKQINMVTIIHSKLFRSQRKRFTFYSTILFKNIHWR